MNKPEGMDPMMAATHDALLYGVGVLILQNTERGFKVEHVPTHRYLELADALKDMNEKIAKGLQ